MDQLRDFHELTSIKLREPRQELPLGIPCGLKEIDELGIAFATQRSISMEILEHAACDGMGNIDTARKYVGRPAGCRVLPYQ